MTYEDGQKLAMLRRSAGSQATAYSIREAGHMVMLDQPDAMVDVMLNDLAANTPGGGKK